VSLAGSRSTGPGSDVALVDAAKTGDSDALDALLRLHHPRLRALCQRLTGSPADADDACQEALIALARGLPRFDGRSTFATWAYRVTTNTCLDELRRRRRRPDPDLVVTEGGGHGTGRAPDAAEEVAARLDVDAALTMLAPEFRAAVVLRDLCQLSYAEIAEALVVPVGTVRSRIARGRGLLLHLLSGNPSPGDERPRS
jgi:RNA polymerase sigma-70 factor (ECF subfamily)